MLKDDAMNGKISLAVTLAFIIALSSFIPFYEEYRVPNVWEINNDPFFQKISQIENEKLFIIGGSAVGQWKGGLLAEGQYAGSMAADWPTVQP